MWDCRVVAGLGLAPYRRPTPISDRGGLQRPLHEEAGQAGGGVAASAAVRLPVSGGTMVLGCAVFGLQKHMATWRLKDMFFYLYVGRWFTLDAYRWALSIVWSRFVTVSPDGRRQLKAMVPYFDMINHDPHTTMRHGLAADGRMYLLTGPEEVGPGESPALPPSLMPHAKVLS